MTTPSPDRRSPDRVALDEQIAAEPPLSAPDLPPDAIASPIEAHLAALRRPSAVAGVVENGLVRSLDPSENLPEYARVIIVATQD